MYKIKTYKNGIIIKVYVKPRSPKIKLVIGNDDIIFYTNAKPVKNEANKSLIKYISKKMDIHISQVKILSGYKERVKTVLIEGIDEKTFIEKCITEN